MTLTVGELNEVTNKHGCRQVKSTQEITLKQNNDKNISNILPSSKVQTKMHVFLPVLLQIETQNV